MNQSGTRNILFYCTAIIVSTLFLMLPAFYNHYPIFNPDSTTYIDSGFLHYFPDNRPIIYGLLLVIFSLHGLSAWPVIFIQGAVVSWLIFELIRTVIPGSKFIGYGLLTILLLSTCTSLSWVVCQLQPDLYTSVACLSGILILIHKGDWRHKACFYAIFFVSVAVHLSHPFLFAALFICLFFLKKLFVSKDDLRTAKKRILALALLSLSAIVCMGLAFSHSKHVFFLGSLVDKGVLKIYLDENCDKKQYALCKYKDNMPTTGDGYWWDANSPLYKIGGWDHSKAESLPVIHDILTTPRYLGLYIKATCLFTCRQAVTFKIGDGNDKFAAGSSLYIVMEKYFPGEIAQFGTAKQNTTKFGQDLDIANKLFTVILAISLLATMALSALRWRRFSWEMRAVIVITFVALIVNFADCAAFTVINGRYGCKIVWMIPLCAILLLTNALTPRVESKNTLV